MNTKLLLLTLLCSITTGLSPVLFAGESIHIEKRASTNPEMAGMNREQRHAYRQKINEEWLQSLTPEQRELWTQKQQARKDKRSSMSKKERRLKREEHRKLREKIRAMTPEERRNFIQEKQQERLAGMSEEERELLKLKKQFRQQKWDILSPEEQEEVRNKMHQWHEKN